MSTETEEIVMEQRVVEEADTTGPKQPRMIDIVAAELHDLQQYSLKFRTAMDNAKTKAKKTYYQKKLKKNNKKMMNMLVAFEKLRGREADTSADAENIPEPEIPSPAIIPDDQ